jgi:hypothetical protein
MKSKHSIFHFYLYDEISKTEKDVFKGFIIKDLVGKFDFTNSDILYEYANPLEYAYGIHDWANYICDEVESFGYNTSEVERKVHV